VTTTPLLGELSLAHVQQIEHCLEGGFSSLPVAGLAGELQQRTARPSHRIRVRGLLFGDSAADALRDLQAAAAAGDELTFAADITTALELQKVVIQSFRVLETAGHPTQFSYELVLVESPPLPPPAELEAFGGLGDFGVGDLGFDTDILGDLEDLASDVASAVEQAADALEALSALAGLDGISVGGLLSPVANAADAVSGLGSQLSDAVRVLDEVFRS
jgi:hypothetical protein